MNEYSQLTTEVIHRHNKRGPRYTSYPTVPNWETGDFNTSYREYLQIEKTRDNPLSLYLHLPFCRRLCTFCGCNRFITKDQDLVERYIKALGRELETIGGYLGKKTIRQLHLGGGTPTFFTVEQLERIIAHVEKHFTLDRTGEMALEVHPKVTTREQLKALADLGFRRLSLGVQDLDPGVQKAINRDQTYEETWNNIQAAREFGFNSINIDLVYGLPRQTVPGFRQTMEQVHEMRPDRLAVYNFAYIPGMFKSHERAIHPEDLPKPEDKIELYLETIRFFTGHDYVMIGMDHYARPTDELAIAQQEKTLHRNFMGYTTLKGLSQIGIGVSSISDFGNGYFQNEKILSDYMNQIEKGLLPQKRMCALKEDDVLRRDLIETILCHAEIEPAAFESKYGINFNRRFSEEVKELEAFIDQKLVYKENGKYILTALGRLFMRNIAIPFDRYFDKGKNRQQFSSTV